MLHDLSVRLLYFEPSLAKLCCNVNSSTDAITNTKSNTKPNSCTYTTSNSTMLDVDVLRPMHTCE